MKKEKQKTKKGRQIYFRNVILCITNNPVNNLPFNVLNYTQKSFGLLEGKKDNFASIVHFKCSIHLKPEFRLFFNLIHIWIIMVPEMSQYFIFQLLRAYIYLINHYIHLSGLQPSFFFKPLMMCVLW